MQVSRWAPTDFSFGILIISRIDDLLKGLIRIQFSDRKLPLFHSTGTKVSSFLLLKTSSVSYVFNLKVRVFRYFYSILPSGSSKFVDGYSMHAFADSNRWGKKIEKTELMTSSVIVGEDEEDSFTKPLGRLSVFYYGVGHMLNDITASCWFTYLLLFLTQIGLSPRFN